jgi:hypothetical protein
MAVLAVAAMAAGPAVATPSTVFWTPCSMDIQPFGSVHLSYDNYTSLGRRGDGKSAFPNDLGLTAGLLPFAKLQAEAGFDWLEPSDAPLVLNLKVGAPEGALFAGAPALQAGLFGLGFREGVNDANVVDFIAGVSLPGGTGRVHTGAYLGNGKLLLTAGGRRENAGVMMAYDLGLFPADSPKGAWNRLVLAADWMSGRNALGGGGAGLSWYFSRDAAILAGPVWFNEPAINGDWKWTTQFDANF